MRVAMVQHDTMVSRGVRAPKRRFACKRPKGKSQLPCGTLREIDSDISQRKKNNEKHRKTMYIFAKIPAWFTGCASGFATDRKVKYVGVELC